jgi:predicted flap endonuclease-1-like 5' DNA nuclease
MLKKLAKVLGIVGAAVAVAWAMRDRFVSVTTSREPEQPMFRTPSQGPLRDVDVVDGIGPVFAKRLNSAGISSVGALAKASPDSVAEAAGVSAARARSWIEKARQTS